MLIGIYQLAPTPLIQLWIKIVGGMLKSKHITDEKIFDLLKDEWDAVAGSGMTDTPFQSLAYQKAWWTHLQPAGSTLHTIVIRDEADQLVAIAPFYLLDKVLYFNGSVEETDYLDLICPADQAEAAWAATIDCLCQPNFPNWTSLDLCNIPEKSPSRTLLPQLSESRGFSLATEIQEVCPVITLPDSFDDYLDSLDKKQRRETRRKIRRALGSEATLKMVSKEDDLESEINDFLTLLQQSTPDKDAWLNAGRTAVFHDVAKAALDAGTLQLLFFMVENKKAAALFNFDYKGRVWVYNSGLNPMAFGHLSAGVVLSAWSIEKAIEDQRNEFDFLRGNETYKYKLGAVDTTIHRVTVAR